MFRTGLDCYQTVTVENFTSDFGMKIRRCMNVPWRKILKFCTKRKIILEHYPELSKKEQYVFVANHSFDEDAILENLMILLLVWHKKRKHGFNL